MAFIRCPFFIKINPAKLNINQAADNKETQIKNAY
jgi:hypothetical protein